jgi:alginate O-acetyltransferase complex protein AlgI
MSLSGWFKDYVYIPLGGSRCSKGKQIRNIFIVWLLTGFWHGAAWNFILWGLWFALLLFGERYVWKNALAKLPRLFQHGYAMLLVIFSWVLFRCESLGAVGRYLAAMFGFGGGDMGMAVYFIKQYWVYLVIGIIASLPVKTWAERKLADHEGIRAWGSALLALILLALSFLQLISSTFNPFIYYRF